MFPVNPLQINRKSLSVATVPTLLASTFAEGTTENTENLTLYAETQLLLLVGDVAADCTHQRHGNGADDARDGAHLGCCLCEGDSVRQAQRQTANNKNQNTLTVVVVVLVNLVVVSTWVSAYGRSCSNIITMVISGLGFVFMCG